MNCPGARISEQHRCALIAHIRALESVDMNGALQETQSTHCACKHAGVHAYSRCCRQLEKVAWFALVGGPPSLSWFP